MVTVSLRLAEAAFQHELYRILHSMFRNQAIKILTETRVVSNSDKHYTFYCQIVLMNYFLGMFGLNNFQDFWYTLPKFRIFYTEIEFQINKTFKIKDILQ